VVVNATGAWSDELRSPEALRRHHMRPLRGSHLILPYERLPLSRAVTFLHPRDARPVFALPWEGVVLFGTTDVDHRSALEVHPSISGEEAEYLMDGLRFVFPGQELCLDDVLATYSGLRPVVDTGKANPSKESREHVIWDENGLLTVSGGKLTTFRIMARSALTRIASRLGLRLRLDPATPVLAPAPGGIEQTPAATSLPAAQRLRLAGRYGAETASLCSQAIAGDWSPIGDTPYLWAELSHAARAEGVVHLEDLLLRRVRLGLLLPDGGLGEIERIRRVASPALRWSEDRWKKEIELYRQTWKRGYTISRL
jgi:glycerol-3-phosphate dehydrogenase